MAMLLLRGSGGVFLLHLVYQTSKNKFFNKIIKLLAKSSYEIFLIQMAILVILPSARSAAEMINSYGVSTPKYVLGLLMFIRIVIVFIVSIWGGYLLNILYNNFLRKIEK